jgi:hypothetical protein
LSSTNLLSRKIDRRTALKVGGVGALTTLAGASPARAATAPTVGGATTWLNVRSFGAAGNGQTDDTAALNAACAAARALPTPDGVATVYLPAGNYKITNTINVWNVFLKGDGQGATRIIAAHDWAASGAPNSSWALDQQPSSGTSGGVGLPAPDATSVGAPPRAGTWIEDLWVMGPADRVYGEVNCHLSGIRVGGGAGYSRLRIDGFFAGSFIFSDHEKLLGPGMQGGNYYGIYYGEPSPSNGDQVIADIELDGAGWASIGVSANTCFGNASFRKLHLGQGPFGIYKEESTGTSLAGLILSGVVLTNVSFEGCANGNIFANGPTGGNASVAQCVFDASPSVNALDPGSMVPLSTTDRFGRPIGRMNAPIDLGKGTWGYNEVLGQDPAYPRPGVTTYSAVIACGMFIGGRFGRAEDGLGRVAHDGKLFTTGGCEGDALIMSRATSCRLLRSSQNGILTGDLVESSGGGTPGCQRSTGGRLPLGVAMHGASNAQSVAVAFSGLASVRCGTNTINPNDPLIADPSQVGCVKAGMITSTNIVGVAQQPSSNGTVSMIIQGL